MASFHLLHWMPDPRLHIFNGYNEVIETVLWGLRALGHDATYAVNRLRADAVNIVFGAQMMHRDTIAELPDDTIVYNLEQLHGLEATGRSMEDFVTLSERFVVWDYSAINVVAWNGRYAARDARHVPIGFAPVLARIAKPPEQDIDVLLYGAPSESRLAMLGALCDRGLATMFVCGLYREARDALIGRAKLILNVASNAHSGIFSIVRASYLLANRKAVVADFAQVESDIAGGVAFAAREQVPDLCRRLAVLDADRLRLEQRGHDIIVRRDIREILRAALHPSLHPLRIEAPP